MRHMLFLGLGYSAARLAPRLAADGWRISGTARTPAGAAALAASGWEGLVFDGASPSPGVRASLATATHVLASVPPEPTGDPALIHHGLDLAAAPRLGWIGYFSTVGVYGDHAGGWVDEATPCHPVASRARNRLAAEAAWCDLAAATGKAATVLRLPGIYGPGRSAIDAIRAGTARRIVKPGQVFNRIHVEDIAGAVLAAIALPTGAPPEILNLTDDEPAPPQDVVAFAAGFLGLPAPPEVDFAAADLSPMARSFYGDCKRVSNRRMTSRLGVRLSYPTYRQGLAALAGN